MKLFTNDMELALSKRNEKALELGTNIEISDANYLLDLYLKEKFNIAINGSIKDFQFLGKEFEKDAMYVYLEINDIGKIQEIEVRASMLLEEFIEQENIIKINVNEHRKSLFLINGNDKALLKF